MASYYETMSGGIITNGYNSSQAAYTTGDTKPVVLPFGVHTSSKYNNKNSVNFGNVQSNGLKHWWNFNNSGGYTAYDAVSGDNLNLVGSTDPESNWIISVNRNGFIYNSSGTTYLESNNSIKLDTNNQMSIAIRVLIPPSTFNTTGGAFVSKNDGGQNGFIIGWDTTNGFTIRLPSGTGQQAWVGKIGYVPNIWYHIVVVYNGNLSGSNNRLKIFINGVQKSLSFSGPLSSTIPTNSIPLRIGATTISGVPSFYCNARFDDIRHYNRAINLSEIKEIANQNSPKKLISSKMVVATTYVPDNNGALLSGTALIFSNFVTKGGVNLKGTISSSAIRSIVPASSGLFVNGRSDVVSSYVTQGGVVNAGSALTSFTYVMQGGLYGNGSNYATGLTNEPPFGKIINGSIANGGSNSNKFSNIAYESNGQIFIILGSAKSAITNAKFNTYGGFSLDGSAIVKFSFTKLNNFYWNLRSKIERDCDFYWNLGQLNIFWYRIVSKPIAPNNCPIVGNNCCQQFVMNVSARSISELCQKLKNRNYKFPIQSVEKLSKPAENSQLAILEQSGIDPSCQNLVPVQICSVPACADFCIDYDLKQTMSMTLFVQINAFFYHNSEGSAFTSGSSIVKFTKNVPNLSYVASGLLSVSSLTDSIIDPYQGMGGSIIGGNVYLESSRWEFIGGVYPNIRNKRYGLKNLNKLNNIGDIAWDLPDRVNRDDSLFAQSDISFGKKTQSLITYGFGQDVPIGVDIIGIQVRISRVSTQVGLRDVNVYLVKNNQRISDNLANTLVDWPLIETERIYGSNGLDGKINWRDPQGDYYLGPLTVDDINDPTFGVEISVAANSFLPVSIAKINYINLQVYYKEKNGSLINISGESIVSSPSYHYSSSGKIVVGNLLNSKQGFRFLSNGLGVDGFSLITISGHSTLFLLDEMQGGFIASGEANKSYLLKYTSVGGFSLISNSFVPEIKINAVGSGQILLESLNSVRSSSWKFKSENNIISLNGESNQRAGDFNTDFVGIGFGMSILQTNATFADDVDMQNISELSNTINKCDCSNLPLIIGFYQNLSSNNILSKFLFRNNYVIPNTLIMRYNANNDSWQSNLHYRGQSAESGAGESWDIICELLCSDVIGGIGVGRSIWKLSVQVIRKNTTTGENFETRIMVCVIPDGICSNNSSGINFNVAYNTQLNIATIAPNAVIYQNTIFDNIGLFKNQYWSVSPTLILKITQSGAISSVQRIDLTQSVSI